MKKITTCIILAILVNACKKTELPAGSVQDPGTETSAQKKGGGGGTSSPTVTTTAATFILSFGATSGGSVSSGGGGNSVTERGVCVNTSPNPTISHTKFPSGSGSGSFTTVLSGLLGGTTYYARAYATKSSGTTYGNEISFTTETPVYGSVTDGEGNVYPTISIGTQVWMMENLRTTKYSNGASIPEVTDNAAWYALSTGAFCNYNNDAVNVATYGRLYNGYAVFDPQNIAPAGWHVPTYNDWQILINHLGGLDLAGGRAKEAGLAHWTTPNTGADNSSGFTALPAGERHVNFTDGSCSAATPVYFRHLGANGTWWTSTTSSGGNTNFTETDYNSTRFYRAVFLGCDAPYDRRSGYSIRLVRD